MKKFVAVINTLVIVLSLTSQGYPQPAQNPATSPIAMSEVNPYRISPSKPDQPAVNNLNVKQAAYEGTPVEKMGDGVMNVATSWADVPAKIAEVSERDNLFLGVTLGFGEGIVEGLARGASGVADTATFGMPPYDKPLMRPEYKVENTDKPFKVNLISW